MSNLKTVFSKREEPWEHLNEMAVVYSHRAAFVLYCIYAAWGLGGGLLATAQHNFLFTFWFAWAIFPTAVLCGIGALFFPRLARLEMSAAFILVTLLGFFEANQVIFLARSFDFGQLNAAMLDVAFAVVPLARAIFVFRAFVETGNRKKVN